MAGNTIRVGIVGAGANTRSRHISGLRQQAGVEIAAVCNRSRESSVRVAAALDIPQVFDDWRALVQSPEIDAVLVGTWPYMHAPVTIAALEADKHVLCEARMAMNAAEAQAMLAASRARPHLVAQLVPSPFTLRVDAAIKRLLAEGYLGELLAIEVRDYGDFIEEDAPLHWRQDSDFSGYNVMSLGIWYEAIMRWVGEAVHVMAQGKVCQPVRYDEAGELRAVRIPDHLDITAGMACGAQLHIQISRVSGFAGPAEAFLFGRKGTLRFSDGRLYGGQRGDDALAEINISPEQEGHWRVEAEFINAIRGQEAVRLTTFETGVKYMRFTEAAARSMAAGRAVALPSLE